MNLIQTILQIVLEGLGLAKKIVPSEKMQEEKFDEKKELREQDFNQEKLNDDFNYCKKRAEIDMWDFVRNTHPKMDMQTLVRHHKMLVARVVEYRKDVVKRRGLRWKKYEAWLEENQKK